MFKHNSQGGIGRKVGAAIASVATALTVAFVPGATAAAQPAPQITWEPCPVSVTVEGAQCGRIDVPMRYDQPDGRKISIGFVRSLAQQPGARRGALFGNPGGPGGDAYTYFHLDGNLKWPQEIRNEWDLVAVQPRGLQHSTPIVCEDEPGADQIRVTAESTLNTGGYLRRICQTGEPGYPETITTENNARDWEEVRRALGYDRISIMGLSYGTYLGSVYATLFPEKTDKVILDSAMDPNIQWTQLFTTQQGGYERALNEFFAYVAMNDHRFHMGDTPLKAYQYWSRKVVEETGTNPTVVPPPAKVGDLPPGLEFAGQAGADLITATGKARVEGEGIVSRMLNPGASQLNSPLVTTTRILLPQPMAWDDLAAFINGTIQQGGGEVPEEVKKEAEKTAESNKNVLFTQVCNENVTPPDYGLLPTLVWSNYISMDPFTSVNALFASGAACNGAPPVVGRAPLDGSRLATRPLQINATRDPQTVYEGRGTIHHAMGTQLVTVHGPGHAHVAAGNPVVDRIAIEYLRTGKVTQFDAPGYFEAQGQ